MQYWLMKVEPDSYSINDLEKSGRDCWDGVRNYQARNFMRDKMQIGDLALFYHSNAKPPGVVGLAKVASEAYPDHTALDAQGAYYDPKATEENPRWYMVDIEFVEKFPRMLSLTEMRYIKELEEFSLLRKGNRLSILPVESQYFELICRLCRQA